MYNGIGLQSSRGSGTSGHIQTNLSLSYKKPQNRDEFLKELQEKRKVNLAPLRKANPQIVQHERKRQILIQTMKLRAKLEADGESEDQIIEKIKRAEELLKNKYEKGQLQTKAKDTHVVSQAKQKEYMKLSKAFGLQHDTKNGSAFNFEAEREAKLRKMEEKRQKPAKFQCSHSECGKAYDSQQFLDRHLKYKHPSQHKQIKSEPKQQKKQ